MKRFSFATAYLFSLLLGAWSGAKAMLDWLGRLGAAQDIGDPHGLAAKAFLWLFSSPWWVPGAIAAAFGAAVLLSLRSPKDQTASQPQKTEPLDGFFNTLPGQGGSVRVRGTQSGGIGGAAGVSGLMLGGPGGNVDIEGVGSFGRGGAGGNAPQSDGRGGRPTAFTPEVMQLPTEFWSAGRGGRGANTPEYDRRLAILIQIKKDYARSFPEDIPFIEAGIDPLPEMWINARLREMGEHWFVRMGQTGYEMI